jgi:hypothetical protein
LTTRFIFQFDWVARVFDSQGIAIHGIPGIGKMRRLFNLVNLRFISQQPYAGDWRNPGGQLIHRNKPKF